MNQTKNAKKGSRNWVQHALRQSGWRPQRQVIAVGTLGIFVALIMGALYLSQVALEASRGLEMRELIQQRDELERTNEELRVEIAELKSLPNLQARAQALGFTPADRDDIEYLVVDGYTANREQTVAQPRPEDEAPPLEYTETFGDWFRQQLAFLREQFEGFSNPEG
ncbi:MAG: hypothetical protein MUF87_09780 [Anaerolineae bacterium]|jgi:hypothetical protein|nr:hypothetical protein [Anaerolineae bacterium]